MRTCVTYSWTNDDIINVEKYELFRLEGSLAFFVPLMTGPTRFHPMESNTCRSHHYHYHCHHRRHLTFKKIVYAKQSFYTLQINTS